MEIGTMLAERKREKVAQFIFRRQISANIFAYYPENWIDKNEQVKLYA